MTHQSFYGMTRHLSLVIGQMDFHKMVLESSTQLFIHQRYVYYWVSINVNINDNDDDNNKNDNTVFVFIHLRNIS